MTRLLALVLCLGAVVSAQAPAPDAAKVQAAIVAARKVVENARAALVETKEYQALLDAQAALKAVEALVGPPVVAPVK